MPCRHSGKCVDGVDNFTCDCCIGYIGNNCETNLNECVSVICQNGGTCKDGIIPTRVNVKVDTMETIVKTISMNVTITHVRMVECVRMGSIHTYVNVWLAMEEAIVKSTSMSVQDILVNMVGNAAMALIHTIVNADLDTLEITVKSISMNVQQILVRIMGDV